MKQTKILVEVVACTADDALRAQAAGADRIELVSAISEGGLTPSIGALKEVGENCHLPVMVMIRPRGGGFVYSDSEFRTMLRDVEALREEGADGFVVGILTPEGSIDEPRMRQIVRLAGNLPVVCHRAFDLTVDSDAALDQLISLGFRRVLSNGQSSDALSGALRLKQMRERTGARIEILPGGGVRATNVGEIVRLSGADQVHLGPFVACADVWSGSSTTTMASHLALDSDEVAEVVRGLGAAF